MKKSTILLSALLLIAVSATIFVSCRKDLHEVALNNNNSIEKAEAQLVYEKIMKFREASEHYQADMRSDNGFVSPMEARVILDGAINYEFSDMNRTLKDTELDTLRYPAPATNEEGDVAVNELIKIYERVVANIGNDINNVNYFMILYPMANSRSSEVEVVFTRGIQPPTPEPIPYLNYFAEGENWIWNYDNGRCDLGGYSDAAQELSRKCHALLHPNDTRDIVDTMNVNGHMMYDVEYFDIYYNDLESFVHGLDYWLFHAENVSVEDENSYCLSYDNLNLYLRNINSALIRNNGCYHYSPTFHSPIREINIKGLSTCAGSLYNINHYAHSYYYKIGLPR